MSYARYYMCPLLKKYNNSNLILAKNVLNKLASNAHIWIRPVLHNSLCIQSATQLTWPKIFYKNIHQRPTHLFVQLANKTCGNILYFHLRFLHLKMNTWYSSFLYVVRMLRFICAYILHCMNLSLIFLFVFFKYALMFKFQTWK